MGNKRQVDEVIAVSQGEQASVLFNLPAKLKTRPLIKRPQQFLSGAVISLAIAGVVPGLAHLVRANDLVNPIPVEGTRFEGNLGPVNVIEQGQFSSYVPFMRSVRVALDAWQATPAEVDQVQMNARAYFASRSETGQAANGCVIRSYAKPWDSSKVYIGADNLNSPTIMNRNLLDFVIPAHELTHCLYNIEEGVNIRNEHEFDPQYFSSVMETAGDLGMVLLYAQKTGTFDAFENMLRLERRADISVKNQDHTTAWALDVLLKDIDPQAMTQNTVAQIATIMRETMAAHFERDGFLVNPDQPGAQVTPAMQAVRDEITAQRWLAMARTGKGCPTPQVEALVDRLRDDVRQSLANNQNRFISDLSEQEKRKIFTRTISFADDMGFPYSAPVDRKPEDPGYEVSDRDLPF